MPFFNPAPQIFTPTTGQTIQVKKFDGKAQDVLIAPASGLAALSLVFPMASPGQTLTTFWTQAITLVTMTAANNAAGQAVTIQAPLAIYLGVGAKTWTYWEYQSTRIWLVKVQFYGYSSFRSQ